MTPQKPRKCRALPLSLQATLVVASDADVRWQVPSRLLDLTSVFPELHQWHTNQ